MRVLVLFAVLPIVVACRPPDPPRDGTLHRDQTFEHGGITRSYHLYEPSGFDGPRPLALTLHGGGGEIDAHIGVDEKRWPHQVWLDIADEEGLFILVPQGVDNHWNDCRADCERCPETDDVGFLTSLIDDVAARFDIDTSRVYTSGESNGGFMSQRLAQEAPEHFAAVGSVIALEPANSECTPQDAPMPIQYQLGTTDAAIPYEGGTSEIGGTGSVLSASETAAYWRSVNQCDATSESRAYDDLDEGDSSTVTREDWACPATGTAVAVLTMDGAGHVAPSVDVQVSGIWEGIAGIQNHDIEGARELWEFFAPHARAP